jgi:23S rRNA (adenine2503-C2)-methyltransferase
VTEDFNQLVPLDAGNPVDGGLNIFGENRGELARRMAELGEPAWRGRQLAEAIYQQRVTGISLISTLPRSLRERLAREGWQVGRPRIAQVFRSVDGT